MKIHPSLKCALFTFFIFPAFILNASDFKEIEWVELMPNDDLAALLDRPKYLDQVADGSADDSVDNFKNQDFNDEKTQRYQQALRSMRVIESFNHQAIRIPGFIVPLQQNEDKKVTEFFIVPYFGACIHLPPPPPNQMIYAKSKQGVELEDLNQPFWFEGTVNIEAQKHSLGTSAYTMALANVMPYEDE
ncbi:DUF3299 domain-containing protein [Neptunicella marina]|uniref:DUF3299 domain-containing protein n=1 Tax=Neptunicella marina TaxID=2125989 RepID=A0A8J6M173_9ALTE|nr:DUF3299 domain-containing protein [Neptunicella marina]MBC3765217.1 DUF3299 domain-containing protein [Neptunicella marina]